MHTSVIGRIDVLESLVRQRHHPALMQIISLVVCLGPPKSFFSPSQTSNVTAWRMKLVESRELLYVL